MDMDLLKEKNINPITPVVVCGGADDKQIEAILKEADGKMMSF